MGVGSALRMMIATPNDDDDGERSYGSHIMLR